MFNPLYLLAPPVLIVASLPLVGLAILTTSLAVVTLLIRVSIVYFELGVALIHSWLFTSRHLHHRPAFDKQHRSRGSSGYSTPTRQQHQHHHRRRRSSAASLLAAGDQQGPPRRPPTKSESFASLVSTAGPNRDFEGIGGWRMSGDGEEEALWIGMNSRLELPTALPDKRRHQRSLTGGSQRWSWSPEAIKMSPVQSRARTPNNPECPGSPDEYFTMHHYSRKNGSWDTIERRKSSGGSSTCSTSSSGRTPRTATRHSMYG
ncbi:hypothetical protein SLS55_000533 [Diplodia seriata]|uniref:Uncharacterized protein n=2 Tax=Diplodia TaxID=66735 RepID=A0A0G2EA59_9PEZI|nr:hypothetical protein UCDDS831_g05142 [Diplodia seriata]